MKDDEIQLIEWVENSNSFQRQALGLVSAYKALAAKNKALKEVNAALRAINISVAKKEAEGQPDLVWLTRDDLQEYSDIEQAGGIKAIKVAAINGFSDYLVNTNQVEESAKAVYLALLMD